MTRARLAPTSQPLTLQFMQIGHEMRLLSNVDFISTNSFFYRTACRNSVWIVPLAHR